MSSLLSVCFIALFCQKMLILLGLRGHALDFVLKDSQMNYVQYVISEKALISLSCAYSQGQRSLPDVA
jgi:hypothetical protein